MSADPIRHHEFSLEDKEHDPAFTLALPSVGVDFGSYHVRVAVARKADGKLLLNLATFTADALQHALSYAKAKLDGQSASTVSYTGHSTPEHLNLLADTFGSATEFKKQEKLTSHSNGAHFLLSAGIPDDQLFHNMSHSEELLNGRKFDFENMRAFMPAKTCESFDTVVTEVQQYGDSKFPMMLSVVGNNNVICCVNQDGTHQITDVRSCAGNAMTAWWKYAKPAGCPVEDFKGLLELARKGDRRRVDSLTDEILQFVGFYSVMPRDYPIFNFGKMENLSRDQLKVEDLARAIIGQNTDMMFNKALDLSMLNKAFQVYFTGSLVQEDFIRDEVLLRYAIWVLPGMKKMQFFKTDATAALGACLQRSS